MAVFIGMMGGAMVFSSFVAPKTNDETVCSQIDVNDGWREVGVYFGRGQYYGHESRFRIWEKDGMCNAYYWVYQNTANDQDKDPDKTSCPKGALRQNSNKEWYAAYDGEIYIIKDF